jgi:hypothetical protein
MRAVRHHDHFVLEDFVRRKVGLSRALKLTMMSSSPALSAALSTSLWPMTALRVMPGAALMISRQTGGSRNRATVGTSRPHQSRQALADVADLAHRVLGGDPDRSRAREQRFPRGRDPDTPALALEELRSERLLQPPHATGEGGLGPVQRLGCAAQVPQLGDHLEVAQVPQVQFIRHDYRS